MRKWVAGVLILSLAGCGAASKSKLNPVNWFGQKEPKASAAYSGDADKPDPALSDPRPLVSVVSQVIAERASGGLILRATGTAPGPGYWGGELVPLAGEKPVGGVLVYLFRISPPDTEAQPNPLTQTAAHFIPDAALEGARSIVVRGADGQKSIAR